MGTMPVWALDTCFGLLATIAAGFLAVAVTAMVWIFGAWNDSLRFAATTPGSLVPDQPGSPTAPPCEHQNPPTMSDLAYEAVGAEPRTSFTLLVPARHEAEVLGDTLERLAHLDHPRFEVVVIVGDDDPPTASVAAAAAARWPDRVRTVVDDSVPKSKPAALNAGLAVARGEVVGVFDAEDDVGLDVLRAADVLFSRTGADVVQGTVQLVTLRDRWFSTRNCLEYLLWYRGRLLAHAKHGFVPLGGNTVFIRRRLLRAVGGWDASCLAEDCELGIRLSARGARIAVAYEPSLATREETPATVRALVRQRTRWNQGFLQVLRAGWWRQLPTRRQRALAAYVLAFPFVQAAAAVLTPLLVVLAVTVQVPLGLTLWAFAPLLVFAAMTVLEAVALGEMARVYHVPVSWRDSARVLWSTIPYMVLLALAAVRAAWRELRGQRGWEKTDHAGAHRRDLRPGPIGGPVSAATYPDGGTP